MSIRQSLQGSVIWGAIKPKVELTCRLSILLRFRFLTYSYLSSFNARLLLSPIILSYDWQMGSIQLITSISDVRNLSALILFCTLITIMWKIYRHAVSCSVEVSHTHRNLNTFSVVCCYRRYNFRIIAIKYASNDN